MDFSKLPADKINRIQETLVRMTKDYDTVLCATKTVTLTADRTRYKNPLPFL